MKHLKALWALANGKKTVVSAIYWGTLMPALMLYFPAGIPPGISRPVTVFGFLLTSLGLGHRWWKGRPEAQE